MTSRVEMKMSPDDRLLMVVHFTEDSNFWIHPDNTVSFVPKKSEIELIKESLEVIDDHNSEKMLKKNFRRED